MEWKLSQLNTTDLFILPKTKTIPNLYLENMKCHKKPNIKLRQTLTQYIRHNSFPSRTAKEPTMKNTTETQ